MNFATRSKIPRGTLSLIELGRLKPTTEHLENLADVFHIGLLDVISAPKVRIEKIRFRSTKPLKSRSEILAFVARELASYSELEELMGYEQNLNCVNSISNSILQSWNGNPESAAIMARTLLGLDSSKKQELIRDLCGLLESRGRVKILRVDLKNPDFFGLSVRDEILGAAVVVNSWERISIERQIFTLAHEFGHLILHKDDYDPLQKEEEIRREGEANQFASHFLMPRSLFEKEYKDALGLSLFDRVLKVKKIFRVSYKAILFRISETYGKRYLGTISNRI